MRLQVGKPVTSPSLTSTRFQPQTAEATRSTNRKPVMAIVPSSVIGR